ncbi:MAG: hypothetical protein ACTSQY_07255, partial [Candidatus Odinarchaeia archaeon]
GVLEGGYNIHKLGYLAANVVAKMADVDYLYVEDTPPEDPEISEYTVNLLNQIKENLRKFWPRL